MIVEFSEKLAEELDADLVSAEVPELRPELVLRKKAELAAEALDKLSAFILDHPLEQLSEQVLYFKELYPRFRALEFYYRERRLLISGLPLGRNKLANKYYNLKLRSITAFFRSYYFHYEYFQLGACELDQQLFTLNRDTAVQPFLVEGSPVGVPPMAELVSRFMALERLQLEVLALLKPISPLKIDTVARPVGTGFRPRLQWTSEVVHLIELAHALHIKGVVNDGQVGVVEFFQALGDFFGVNLGVPKRGFEDLKARKRLSKTHFLDSLRDRLAQKISDADAWRGR